MQSIRKRSLEGLQSACSDAKKEIDRAGIQEYNINEISKYTRDKYMEAFLMEWKLSI